MDSQIETRGKEFSENSPMTVENLQAQIFDLQNDPYVESLEEMTPTPYKEILSLEQELLRKFMEKQLAEKDRFANVFRTEKGSLYFTLNSGESLRIKQQEEGLSLEPLCKKIFYVDKQQGEELSALSKSYQLQEKIIGKSIRTVPCSIGVTPFEFGISNRAEIHFSEHQGQIIIKGDNYGVFASGYHQGHRIVEIIK